MTDDTIKQTENLFEDLIFSDIGFEMDSTVPLI